MDKKAIKYVILACVLLSGLWASTELFAYRAGFAPQLGKPLGTLGGFAFYLPWQILTWGLLLAKGYGLDHPAMELVKSSLMYGIALGSLPVMAIAPFLRKLMKNDQRFVHGSAEWATEKDVKKVGLHSKSGVTVGEFKGHLLIDDSNTHVMMFAPTRSGKGVGVVIPTLCTWPGSVIVNDIKGENWDKTAKYRANKLGQRCIKFNPTDENSAHYNPLAEIDCKINKSTPYSPGLPAHVEMEIADVQVVAEILMNPEGKDSGGGDTYWITAGTSLLTGIIQYVKIKAFMNETEDASLLSVLNALTSTPEKKPDKEKSAEGATDENPPEDSLSANHDRLKKIRDECATWHKETARPILSVLDEMISKASEELSGVMSYATNCLSLYRDPKTAKIIKDSDFKIDHIMNGDTPISLYLVVPPSDISRTKPLIRLILNQLGKKLSKSLSNKKYSVLMLLDEFPTLGRLDFFETALAYLAGYKVRCLLITQSLSQLDNVYGQNNSIMANCSTRICYAPNDDETANRISSLLGQATVRLWTSSEGGGGKPSQSEQYVARPLLTPGEIMQLPQEEEILLMSNTSPIRAKKVFYYKDKRFKDIHNGGRWSGELDGSDTLSRDEVTRLMRATNDEHRAIKTAQDDFPPTEEVFWGSLD